jgi:hypothetical protein
MNLTDWTHNLLNRLRQGVLKVIQSIGTSMDYLEEFRYLEGVNMLYSFLGEMTDYEQNDFNLPKRADLIEEISHLSQFGHPQPRHTICFDLKKLEICPLVRYTYAPPKKAKQLEQEQLPLIFPQ